MSEYNLLNARPTYKPFQYPWAYNAYHAQNGIHWLPEEIPMEDDISDYWNKLTENERNTLTQILRFFVQSDLEVQNNYMTNIGQVFRTPECAMMLMAFANMEGIHVQAYAHLIDTLGLPEIEYSAFLSYKEMSDKADYIHHFDLSDKETPEGKYQIARNIAVFGAFMEGVQLFSSFCVFMSFTRRGLMKGTGKIIKFSIKDESLHSKTMALLFRTFLEENPDVDRKALKEELNNICKDMINLEDHFIDLCFEMGDLEGLTAQEVKDYIRYMADIRLMDFGLPTLYGIEEDPCPWMEDLIGGKELALFFEQKVAEYSKGATALDGKIDWNKPLDYDHGLKCEINDIGTGRFSKT